MPVPRELVDKVRSLGVALVFIGLMGLPIVLASMNGGAGSHGSHGGHGSECPPLHGAAAPHSVREPTVPSHLSHQRASCDFIVSHLSIDYSRLMGD